MKANRVLAFLLVLALVPIPFMPSGSALTTYLETFDDDTPPNLPTSDFYELTTFNAGSFRTSAARNFSAPNSYLQDDNSASTPESWFDASQTGLDLCSGGVFEFKFNMDTLPSTDLRFVVSDAANLEYGGIIVQSTGAVQGTALATDTATTTTIAGLTVAADVWYTVQIYPNPCSTAGFNVYFVNEDIVQTINENGAFTTNFDTFIIDSATACTCDQVYVDNISWVGVDDPVAAPIGSSATASVTDLVGFDVDPTGSIAIARTELGENVQIFSAQTLGTPVGGPVDTNCAAGSNDYEDSVMSKSLVSGNGNTGQLVAFLNCDVSGDAQYLSIRQTNGDIPTAQQFSDLTGETCDPGTGLSECPYNIDLTDFQQAGDSGLGQLGQVRDFPIDYSNNDEVTGQDFRRVAWAWASQQCDSPPGPSDPCSGTEPGDVGVSTFTMQSLVGDEANTDWVTHHPSQDVDDFCLGLDGSSYYLASVVAGQPGHTWSVVFDASGGIDDNVLDASISNSPSSFGSSGFGIACGGGQLLHQNGDSDVQLLSRTGVFIDEVQPGGGDERGVTISEEFIGPSGSDDERGSSCTTALEGTGGCVQYGAYLDTVAGEGVILNVTGGSIVEVGRFTMPSGTFHSIRMDRLGQNVWVATTTTIARFEVTEVTTVTPINIPGDEVPVVPSDDGLFGGSGATIGAAFGVGAFGGNLFLGALLMGIVAYGVGTGYGNVIDSNTMQPRFLRVNPWAAAIGAAIGFLVAWGFGFFSTAVVFSLIALVAMIVGIRLWTARGG